MSLLVGSAALDFLNTAAIAVTQRWYCLWSTDLKGLAARRAQAVNRRAALVNDRNCRL